MRSGKSQKGDRPTPRDFTTYVVQVHVDQMNMDGEIGTVAISSKTNITFICKYHPRGLCRPQGLTKTRPRDNPRQMVKGEGKKIPFELDRPTIGSHLHHQ